jgi:hypothetical protein
MPKTGLNALLRPEDSILELIDHQPYQFANLHSHEPTMVVNMRTLKTPDGSVGLS